MDILPEKHAYTLAEVGELMGISRNTAETLFRKEHGVIVIERPETMHKRRFRTVRVPHAVYERVLRRISN